MKWISLVQMILLILLVGSIATDVKSSEVLGKTLLSFDSAIVPVLAVLLIASLALSITMFILQVKRSKKAKKENKPDGQQ